MLKLHDNEIPVLIIRKHWFVALRIILVFLALLLVPQAVLYLIPLFAPDINLEPWQPMIYFSLSLYTLLALLFLFFSWMLYYLDIWVITTRRILDVTPHGLFNIEIAETPISRVQNVAVEIRGIFETVLKFGTISIETAGERNFSIDEAPNLNEAKDIILRCVDGAKKKDAGAGL